MKKRAHLYIEGKVQGVFYRAFTCELAISLGLKGWVKNLPDGRVEVIFEGEQNKIQQAIASCYKGPPAANVTNIEIHWEEYKGEFSKFEIKYF